jgi:hypothetical protein
LHQTLQKRKRGNVNEKVVAERQSNLVHRAELQIEIDPDIRGYDVDMDMGHGMGVTQEKTPKKE